MLNRRNFLQQTGAIGAAAFIPFGLPKPKEDYYWCIASTQSFNKAMWQTDTWEYWSKYPYQRISLLTGQPMGLPDKITLDRAEEFLKECKQEKRFGTMMRYKNGKLEKIYNLKEAHMKNFYRTESGYGIDFNDIG